MNLWRTTRTEVAGAWRSLRYDMSRRQPAPEPGASADPDVTSTGMSTFGGPVDELRTGYEEFGRPPRRIVAVSVFALLTVAGSAGSYFAVVNGLGALLRERPPAPQAYPMAAAPPAGAAATAGIGRGAPPATDPARVAGTPQTTATAGATSPAAVPTTAVAAQAPRRTTPERGTHPTRTPCACVTPPVPTPTAPSISPSATPSPSVTPTHSGDPSISPSPSASDGSGEPAHRKRRPRGY